MAWIVAGALAAALLLATATVGPQPAWADDAQNADQLVEKALMTIDSFQSDPQMGPSLRALVSKARGVMIYPQVLRGAFLLGGAGGQGVFLVRNQESDTWAGPAFYSFGAASFGLQAGADASEVVLVALTDRGVTALLTASAKLGVNASVAVGPVGAGAEAATAKLSVDLVSYSRNQGLYVGVSVEGAGVFPQPKLDQVYYGRAVTPSQILIQREVSNPHAADLIAAVARVAGGSASIQTTVVNAR
ncbi:MAG TPA: lipid-binding SYLF domain-containing protein [Candidatus Methylomirabilis sp.]|nr:lipid-binding SYLF domain-containing protein [Candidatus Methylomirabilis sp.]